MHEHGDPTTDVWTSERRTGHHLASLGGHGVAVAVPPGSAPPAGWPAILVTDAALHFDAIAAAAGALARRTAKTGVVPAVVIGIASGTGWSHDAERRAHDLVPGEEGQGDALLRRILKTILPAVGDIAAIDHARVSIVGHSLGGLLVLDALTSWPDMVARGVAFSPSLWRAPVLGEGIAALTDAGRLLILSGSREERINADLAAACIATGSASRAILDGEDHGSVVFAGLARALRFLSTLAADTDSQ